MICNNCGGTFASDAAKCPYCGTMNLAGATQAYNQKFEDMNDDLAAMGDEHIDEYKKEFTTQSKRTLRYVGIAFALILVLIGLAFLPLLADVLFSGSRSDNTKDRLTWQAENFALLDELYAAGDYQAILDFEDALYLDDTNDYSIFAWSHYSFIDIYRQYLDFCETQQAEVDGKPVYCIDYACTLHFYFSYHELPEYAEVTESEIALITDYITQAKDFLKARFGFSDDDLIALQLQLTEDDDWVPLSNCIDYIESITDIP